MCACVCVARTLPCFLNWPPPCSSLLFRGSGLLRGFVDNPPNVFCSTDCKAEAETDLPGKPRFYWWSAGCFGGGDVGSVWNTASVCCACDWMPGVMTPLPGHLTLSGQTNTLIAISQSLP